MGNHSTHQMTQAASTSVGPSTTVSGNLVNKIGLNDNSGTVTNVIGNKLALNATGIPIRLYYSGDKMQPEDMMAKSEGKKMNFKAKSPGSYICIPPNHYLSFSGEGVKYANVYLEGSSGSGECVKTIAENYSIPNNKSFIVTANHEIKFQKDGGVIGEDEDGIRHAQQK